MFVPNPAGATLQPIVYYVHTDHLDTPRALLDTAGNLRWTWLAEPFGNTAPNANPAGLGAVTMNLRHPGQYADAESGLFYNYFRDYDPSLGRYTQSDPIGLAGGINTYAYVEGNPVSYVDPDGLKNSVPGYTRPANAAAASSYYQPQGEFTCRLWDCGSSTSSCGRDDLKEPRDFIPRADSASSPPRGCRCVGPGYRQTWDLPTPNPRTDPHSVSDFGDAVSTGVLGAGKAGRIGDAYRTPMPWWYRAFGPR
jgi:RHS repeat-associated protein